jgi:hypothetical protein
MDAAAKERLIARITWGYISITASTQDGKLVSFLLHPPTPKEQAQAALTYSVERQRAAFIGLPPEKELLQNLITLGQWSVEQESEIEGIQKDIETIRRGLIDLIFNVTKLKKAKSLLRHAEKALIERLEKRHMLLQNSAESHAEICRQRYLIGKITETIDGDSFWNTQEQFDDYQDNSLIHQLCEAFFNKMRIPISTIRKLARSSQWRSYWEIAKVSNDLFDNPIASWSLSQRDLAYWSTIYDSVYAAFERPSQDIIEDDDLLDSWFMRQGEKIEGKTKNSLAPKSNKPGRNEEFIMADQEGAKRVYGMNDPGSRAAIRARQKLLASKGTMREQDMPDSQLEIRQQLMDKQKKHVKNISHR